jgi:acetate kinase
MRVLVLNAGSSSLKASIVDTSSDGEPTPVSVSWSVADSAAQARAKLVADAIARCNEATPDAVEAVGYRVVHGGAQFREPALIDDDVVRQIVALDELAPLHNRIAAEIIRAARQLLPAAKHVACFDTAFHASLDEPAWRYPVPADWSERWGIRRYGFHGLSVAWSTERAAGLLDRPVSELNLVVAHLGAGSSVSAVAGGRSVDTSMGFTPLEGLMMGTRSGSIDPGIVFYLLRHGIAADELADALEHRSGLLGVSGRTADVADLERRAAVGEDAPGLALEIYGRRAAAGIAAVATSLDRLDGLVFTGGIGEHSSGIRSAICKRLRLVGIEPPRNTPGNSDAMISDPGASVAVMMVTSREDLVIARQTSAMLTGG